jgi:hypothetical protein
MFYTTAFLSHAWPCGICGGQCNNASGFCPSIPLSVSFHHCSISLFHSTSTSTGGDWQIPVSLQNHFPPSYSRQFILKHPRKMSKLCSTRGAKKKLSHKMTRTHFYKIRWKLDKTEFKEELKRYFPSPVKSDSSSGNSLFKEKSRDQINCLGEKIILYITWLLWKTVVSIRYYVYLMYNTFNTPAPHCLNR